MTAPTHPGERPALRTLVPTFALTAVASALAVVAATTAAPASVRTPLALGASAAALLLCAAVTWAVHAARTARAARRRLEAVSQDLGRLLQQQARATEEARQEQQRLIDELAQQRSEFAESFKQERARIQQDSGQELDWYQQENARLTAELERAARERAAAIAAAGNAAGRMQALATATLADLRAMEDRHSDEEVLADLLHLDHRTAQAGRLADSIAVLTGARSGRRWARPISMESILRGAMGRISGYRRVRVHSVSETAVAGHAAEGVMHALAELLDNAANFSPPTAEVHVYVEEVPAGVIVSVEDSGLVMGEVQLRRAERAVAGDSTELGGLTGTRLGLAVVGRLARKHGLKVSFRPSARGGTGVLMLVPQDLLTRPAADEPASAQETEPAAPVPAPLDPAPVHESAAEPTEDEDEEGPTGLPRRRRGRTLAEAERRAAPQPAEPRPAPAAADAQVRAARFNSFRQAVRPATHDTPSAETTETPGAAGGPAAPHAPTPTHDPVPAPHPESGPELTSHPHAYPEGDPTP
ncbi:ATP-binding protein [Streptomyces sp. Ag109_O5-10]|uniref:sensor histidine kinase n=1 Tax=Streptomyces sp. Ag109_O5-10 TaxID=1855349 RepID=UPI00089A371F|nr:ATP-binding protein [Streptomyces sp. Ag109_O5-10]SEF16689.1 Signal transduction histidine kinase [Streptomyces sp. Ag109_O5-10]